MLKQQNTIMTKARGQKAAASITKDYKEKGKSKKGESTVHKADKM
jgi:hypothetical protein